MKFAAIASLLALLAACQGQRIAIEPMSVLREVPVTYSAHLGPRADSTQAQGKDEPAAPAAPAPDAVSQHIAIECQYWLVEAGDSGELFADAASGAFGRVVSRAEFERASGEWQRTGLVTRRSGADLLLADGGHGNIVTADQTAFVQSFEFESVDGCYVADPSIGVLTAGLALDATSKVSKDGTTIALDLSIANADLVRPIEETSVRLPGTATRVTLQVPIVFAQALAGHVDLARDEVLVVGGLTADSGERRVLASIRASRASAGDAERTAALR